MAIGNQSSTTQVNSQLGNFAVTLHNLMSDLVAYQAWIVSLGQAGLEALGFDSEDAADILAEMDYMASVAGCYFGTVQQGGSGGTGAILFDFDNALIGLTGGAF